MSPEKLFILLQRSIPQHAISRFAGMFAESRHPLVKNPLINAFVKIFGVDMSEALYPGAKDYACFNDFFTRPLKVGLRPLADPDRFVLSPADGAVSQLGVIEKDQIFQAKGHTYSVADLLGDTSPNESSLSDEFENGTFATIYLSPKDYHRVHMPCAGTLVSSHYVPGELFSVNQITARHVPRLFARNERLVAVFETARGKVAVVLVGAVIVAGIRTVWGGGPEGPPGVQTSFPQDWTLEAGQEMGRFYLGSTAVVLFQNRVCEWTPELSAGSPLRLGQAIGRYR